MLNLTIHYKKSGGNNPNERKRPYNSRLFRLSKNAR